MLNSTPLGPVVTERQLYRHRSRAGFQIGDKRRIGLLQYIAWLIEQRQRRREGQSRNRTPTPSTEESLQPRSVFQLLEKQRYRCALTGRQLTPDTTCLDHIVPVSRGGKHCLSNAQLLHKETNRAKAALNNEEFIQLCREVVAHSDNNDSEQ